MTEPQLPPSLVSEGAELAAFDGVITLALAMIKHLPAAKADICNVLYRRFEQHQRIVDEHGSAANANAASAVRLIMHQIGCEELPDHQ
jgi:hypothetical protein